MLNNDFMITDETKITINSGCLVKRILAGIDAYLGISDSKKDYYFLRAIDTDLDNLFSSRYTKEVDRYLSKDTVKILNTIHARIKSNIKSIEDENPFINLDECFKKIFEKYRCIISEEGDYDEI